MRFVQSVILDELVDRWLSKVIALVSLYVMFRGHNAPGGGFAGGLILGSVFVLQYLTGREPHVLGRPIRRPATLLGWGLLVALASAFVPLMIGDAPLESYIWKFEIFLIGEVKWVSSTIFDVGVYLVVVAVVLLILLSLGTSSSASRSAEGDVP